LLDCRGQHDGFELALLLIDDDERFVEGGCAPRNLIAQQGNLRILASQAEDGGPGNVGVMNVSGDQPAQQPGIVPGASAAAFVGEKFDAIDVREDRAASGGCARRLRLV
jgi:hypothetical protein